MNGCRLTKMSRQDVKSPYSQNGHGSAGARPQSVEPGTGQVTFGSKEYEDGSPHPVLFTPHRPLSTLRSHWRSERGEGNLRGAGEKGENVSE